MKSYDSRLYCLLIVLICCEYTKSFLLHRQLSVPAGFKTASTPSIRTTLSVQMGNSESFNSKKVMKSLAVVAATILLSISPLDPSALSTFLNPLTPPSAVAVVGAAGVPAAPSLPTISLEQCVLNLETADNRKDVLQAMADVFETSGARSLQARTKYKQVIFLTYYL